MLRRAIAMLALSGALAGYVTSLLLPRRYEGRASLAVATPALVATAAERTLSPRALSPIILQSPYYLPILDYTPLDELVARIRENSSIALEKNSFCTVRFTDENKYAALDMMRGLIDEMTRNLGDARLSDPIRIGATGPSAALCTFEGLLGGLLAGLCLAFAAARQNSA